MEIGQNKAQCPGCKKLLKLTWRFSVSVRRVRRAAWDRRRGHRLPDRRPHGVHAAERRRPCRPRRRVQPGPVARAGTARARWPSRGARGSRVAGRFSQPGGCPDRAASTMRKRRTRSDATPLRSPTSARTCRWHNSSHLPLTSWRCEWRCAGVRTTPVCSPWPPSR
jgi:hypothetical protein